MCVLSVMFACVASITTDNTDLLVFTLIILHSITLCSFCPLHVQHTNLNTLFNRPNEMVELLKVRTKDFKVDLLWWFTAPWILFLEYTGAARKKSSFVSYWALVHCFSSLPVPFEPLFFLLAAHHKQKVWTMVGTSGLTGFVPQLTIGGKFSFMSA